METNFCILPELQSAYSLTKVVKYLDELGYKANPIVKGGSLFCPKSDESYSADELALVGSFRFEGYSDLEDMSVVYALQADNGTRAVLIDAYGPYADPVVSDFLSNVRDEREDSLLMECIPPKKTIVISSMFN